MNKSRFLRSSYAQLLISNRKEILCFSSIVLLSTSPSAFALETDHLKPTSLEQTQRQKQTIKGNVKDSNGEPVIGANVKALGTTDGTITDFEGNFEIQTTPGTTLQVSYIGYQSQNVTAQAGRPLIVVLVEDTENLDEVVVVGYGTQRKSDVTGSISVATAEDILKTPAFNALDGLKGKAAGVNIFTNSGQPGGNTRVIIRGIGTINSSSNPLYVVDGVVMEEFQY
ncbi:MAG: carboxypeptidase-like regulatory domain-containing protein, partial [Tannerellaceae bacterium]